MGSSECCSHGFTDDAISLNHKRWTHASILQLVLTRILDNVQFIPAGLICCTMQFRCDGQVHCAALRWLSAHFTKVEHALRSMHVQGACISHDHQRSQTVYCLPESTSDRTPPRQGIVCMKKLDADHAATSANQALGACGRRSTDQYESVGLASQTLVGTQRAGVRINLMAIHGEEGRSTLRNGANAACVHL